MFYQHMTQ